MHSAICSWAALIGVENKFVSEMCVPVANGNAFGQHVAEMGLSYATKEEYEFRQSLFMKTEDLINESNSNPNNTFKLAHNVFSTLTADEKVKYRGQTSSPKEEDLVDMQWRSFATDFELLRGDIDWRAKGAVNPVKNQGHCGSCWAFSATAIMESAHFLKTGKLLSLSEQELVDCCGDFTTSDSNPCGLDDPDSRKGCNGGDKAHAMDFLKRGQKTEAQYPYTGTDDKCQGASGDVKTQDVVRVMGSDPKQLAAALAKGPVGVSVYVDDSFHQYSSGIYNGKACGDEHKGSTNHAIASVGWGSTSDGKKYWIVRNSWGTSWGEEGYIRMEITEGAGICNV